MQHYSYFCDNIVSVTNDISLLYTKPSSLAKPLAFQAGQYVEGVLQNGKRLPLSIANAPQDDGNLVFHIRHNGKHPLAEDWLNEIKHSPTILLEGPKGSSTLDKIAPGTSLIFLAGGTGYAPIRSLLLALCQNAHTLPLPPIYFYWGVTHPEDAYDPDTLKSVAEQCASFGAHIVLSDPKHFPTWQGAKGWVHEYCANKHPQLNNFTVFASGPFEMIQAAYKSFTANGLPATQFISDLLNN